MTNYHSIDVDAGELFVDIYIYICVCVCVCVYIFVISKMSRPDIGALGY
jgi:hypothetical protein